MILRHRAGPLLCRPPHDARTRSSPRRSSPAITRNLAASARTVSGPRSVEMAALRHHGRSLRPNSHLRPRDPRRPPSRRLEPFLRHPPDAGASRNRYVEAVRQGRCQPDQHPHRARLTTTPPRFARIRALGLPRTASSSIPARPASAVEHFFSPLVDLVLVMTVQPGFGGQPFRRDMLPKLTQLAMWRRRTRLSLFRLEVDGGIDLPPAPNAAPPEPTPSSPAHHSSKQPTNPPSPPPSLRL